MPMSPCGQRLAQEHRGDRGALLDHAAELLGHADHREAELVGLLEQLGRGGAGVVGGGRGGAELGERELAHRLAQHLLLVARGEVEQVTAAGPGLARRLGQLLGRGEGAPGAGRGAHGRLRGAVEEALGGLAEAEPVDQLGAGEGVDRLEPDRHAPLGEILLG